MTPDQSPIVFPAMDEAVFAAKLARWKAREPPQPKQGRSIYGRPSRKRIQREKFVQHIEAVSRGRFAESAKRGRVKP
jgi:hypothetical protein